MTNNNENPTIPKQTLNGIHPLIEESKVLRLIDRMCNNEGVNYDQLTQIYDLVRKKGHPGTIDVPWVGRIKQISGFLWIGIFVYDGEYDDTKIIRYGDIRHDRIGEIKLYTKEKRAYWG